MILFFFVVQFFSYLLFNKIMDDGITRTTVIAFGAQQAVATVVHPDSFLPNNFNNVDRTKLLANATTVAYFWIGANCPILAVEIILIEKLQYDFMQ